MDACVNGFVHGLVDGLLGKWMGSLNRYGIDKLIDVCVDEWVYGMVVIAVIVYFKNSMSHLNCQRNF